MLLQQEFRPPVSRSQFKSDVLLSPSLDRLEYCSQESLKTTLLARSGTLLPCFDPDGYSDFPLIGLGRYPTTIF